MERYHIRADGNNFWFSPVSGKVESHMHKSTATGNGPPRMYRHIGSAPIGLLLPVCQSVRLFNDSLSVNKF
nr:MAG TPA: hypothetical protein [Caudoviricetes sp.]